MKHNNRNNLTVVKGFTLVEVMVALFISTIILVCFLAVTAYNYRNLSKSKDVIVNSFSTMKKMEEKMREVKEIVKEDRENPDLALLDNITYTNVFAGKGSLYEKTVTVYKISKAVDGFNNRELTTYISSYAKPTYKIPEFSKVNVIIKNSSGNESSIEYMHPSLSIEGKTVYELASGVSLGLTNNYWFYSKKGFNIPISNKKLWYSDLSETYDAFPSFFSSYKVSDKNTATILDVPPEFAGSHVMYAAVPISSEGIYGMRLEAGAPVFLNGLTNLDNLVAHFDASQIGLSDVLESEQNSPAFEYQIGKWAALSGNFKLEPSGGNKAFLKLEKMGVVNNGSQTEPDYTGAYSQLFSTYKKGAEASGGQYSTLNSLELGTMSLFVVVKSQSGNPEDTIIGGASVGGKHDWKLTFKDFRVDTKIVNSPVSTIETNKWYVINVDTSMSYKVANEVMEGQAEPYIANLIGGTIYIDGSSKIDVAEIIIYEGELSSEKTKNVNNYLIGKYGLPN